MGSFYYQKGDKDIKVGLNSSAQEDEVNLGFFHIKLKEKIGFNVQENFVRKDDIKKL